MTLQAPSHPARALLARYREVLGAAWSARHELAGPRRLADESAFLPAALSLQHTPPHPSPRRASTAIVLCFAAALAWSWFGQVDVVAVAPGRIVVSDGSQLVQPLESGVVRAIHVRDGSRVQAGQVLIELDPTGPSADHGNVQAQWRAAQAEAQRSQALLGALADARARKPLPPPAPGSPTDEADAALLRAEWQDIAARQARLAAEGQRREAELATAREALRKLEATLPLVRQRETDIRALSEQGFIAGHAGQDRTRERVEQERDLATQQARVREADAALNETRRNASAYEAETQRSLNERLAQARLKATQLQQEAAKTEARQRLTRLTAPVAGTVQQLAVHTAGGVVTPAQTLLVVVPDDAAITAEVSIENKDIGFVRAGQHAEVKFEAFDFTRYGTVPAVVQRVSADAVADEKRGAVFTASLVLDRAWMGVQGQALKPAPGVNLTAEVKTGRRRVIEFLWSPLRKAVDESGRER